MRKLLWFVLGVVGIAYAVVVLQAPKSRRVGPCLDDVREQLRATGKEGEDLVNTAIAAVAEAIPLHSAWHLWEQPETALVKGRGRSMQYNTVLLLLLRKLGFEARLVHAARVRGFTRPWFLSGHSWVKVQLDGRWLDACASTSANRVGEINFVPLTEELPVYLRTRVALGVALSPFVVGRIWASWLTGQPVPEWIYGERERD